MKSVEALRVLAELSASQWGLLTTAQASARGVSRVALARLAESGQVERIAQGVYRDAGAPGDEFESLRAAWLSLDATRLAEERIGRNDVATVSGATAAWLHGVGDLLPEPYEFSIPNRRQTQRAEIRLKVRGLDDSQITIEHGLPVTALEQTISDLVEARTDLSLVGKVVADGMEKRALDLELLSKLLDPLASRNGFAKGSGDAMLEHLMRSAGVDRESIAAQIASTSLGQLVAVDYLDRLSDRISEFLPFPALAEVAKSLSASMSAKRALTATEAIQAIGIAQVLRTGATTETSRAAVASLLESLPSAEIVRNLARSHPATSNIPQIEARTPERE